MGDIAKCLAPTWPARLISLFVKGLEYDCGSMREGDFCLLEEAIVNCKQTLSRSLYTNGFANWDRKTRPQFALDRWPLYAKIINNIY